MTTPPVVRAVCVPAAPERAWQVLTEGIGGWWPLLSHSPYRDGAAHLALTPDAGLVETLPDGTTCRWGEVEAWDPPYRLAVTWHPWATPRDEEPTRVEVELHPDGDGTRVVLVHTGWERLADGPARRETYDRPGGWSAVTRLYAAAVAGGGLGELDLGRLRTAYGDLAEALEAGPFDTPGDGWPVELVAAHVVTNDALLTAVLDDVVEGRPARLDGPHSQDADRLAAVVDSAGGPGGMGDAVRASGAEVLARASGLRAEHLGVAVHFHVVDGGESVVDDPVPLRAVLAAQADQHLPRHAEQVRRLRKG